MVRGEMLTSARIRMRTSPPCSADFRRAFARKPGAVLGRLVDVILLEFWILAHDLFRCVPIPEKLEEEVDREAQAPNGGFPFTHAGIDFDAIEHNSRLSERTVARNMARVVVKCRNSVLSIRRALRVGPRTLVINGGYRQSYPIPLQPIESERSSVRFLGGGHSRLTWILTSPSSPEDCAPRSLACSARPVPPRRPSPLIRLSPNGTMAVAQLGVVVRQGRGKSGSSTTNGQ